MKTILIAIFIFAIPFNSYAISTNGKEVLLAVFKSDCQNKKARKNYILQEESDFYIEREDIAKKRMEFFNQEAVSNLFFVNKNSDLIPKTLSCKSLHVIPKSSIDAAFERQSDKPINDLIGKEWSNFYSSFPNSNGIIRTSIPGVSSDGNHAVIYLSMSCGVTCGNGRFMEFVKTNGRWEIEKSVESHIN